MTQAGSTELTKAFYLSEISSAAEEHRKRRVTEKNKDLNEDTNNKSKHKSNVTLTF